MNSSLSLVVKNDIQELPRVTAEVNDFLKPLNLTSRGQYTINLVLEEILVNIINYGYTDCNQSHAIDLKINIETPNIAVRIEDDGNAFNPLSVPWPDASKQAIERIEGGLGIFFVRRLKKTIEYRRENEKNILKIKLPLEQKQAS